MIVLILTILMIFSITINSLAYEENEDGSFNFTAEETKIIIQALKDKDKLEQLVANQEETIANLRELNSELEKENIRLTNRVSLLEDKNNEKDDKINLLNQQLSQKDIIISEYKSQSSIPFKDELILIALFLSLTK